MAFLHGAEIVEIDVGTRPIQTSASSIIGLIGTAPKGPVNEPTLIAGSRAEAVAKFGADDGECTIPAALNAIFDQTGAMVVAINVLDPENSDHVQLITDEIKEFDGGSLRLDHYPFSDLTITSAEDDTIEYVEGTHYEVDKGSGVVTIIPPENLGQNINISDGDEVLIEYEVAKPDGVTASDVKGGIDEITGAPTGVLALKIAESVVHVAPRLLIAPGFTGKIDDNADNGFDDEQEQLVNALISMAGPLRAIVIADGPNGTREQAIAFGKIFGSERLYLIDPHVKVFSEVKGETVPQPAAARVAGIIAKSDDDRGFWWSPSNRPMLGINGTVRPIDFGLSDKTSQANILNENKIATIIQQDGYRLWGNRSCASDPKWMFISVRRTADLIHDSLLRSHRWAVDQNITKTYIDSVTEGVNSYLRYLKSLGAIINGICWADPDLNTPLQIMLGEITFNFDFVPPYPAEHITFRSILNNDYLTEVFS